MNENITDIILYHSLIVFGELLIVISLIVFGELLIVIALIVAGDFNAWSKKRAEILRDFTQFLCLKEVNFEGKTNIKKVFKNRLDFVFYRSLEVKSAKAIKCDSFSDHNPIIVQFTTLG